MELANALSLEGYLEKESPTVFKIFQRRYFAFRSKGEFLVWFKRKPTSADEDPKGNDSATQVWSACSRLLGCVPMQNNRVSYSWDIRDEISYCVQFFLFDSGKQGL
jgi:hypothetical protein